MFDRASNAALVCLRCRLRIAPWHNPKERTAIRRRPQALRWQSAVAVRAQDDDGHHEDVETVRQDYDAKDQTPVANLTEPKRKPNRKINPLWKPDRTAKLGVNALGTPSEVLLLPTRDRQFPAVPKEEDVSPKEHVYASLSSEREPLQWDHVKENISNVKSRMDTDSPLAKAEEWNKMVDDLKQGFSQRQLRQYLQESPNLSKSQSRFLDYKKTLPKGVVAALIVKEAWGYKNPHPQSPGEDDKRHDPDIEVTLPMKNEKILLAMQRDPNNALKEIQESLGISASSSVKEGQWFLTLRGQEKNVKEARVAVLTLHKSIKSTLVSWKNCLRYLRQQGSPDVIKSLMQSLSAKYGVEIVVLKNSLKVVATKQNRAAIEHIKRDLLLALDLPQKRTAWQALALQPEQLVLVPTHTTTPAPWPTTKYSWRRCVDPGAGTARTDEAKQKESVALRAKVLRNLRAAMRAPQGPSKRVDGHHVTHTVTFGSFLFHQTQHEQFPLLKTLSSPRSRFSDTVPLLPQLLSHHKMQIKPEDSQGAGRDTKVQQARLLLRPAEREKSAPEIEVNVSLPIDASAEDSVVIRNISIVYGKSKFYTLLPSSVVDLKFAREVRRDVFRLGSDLGMSEAETQVLRSIEHYLRDASLRGLQNGEANCFLTLPTIEELKTSGGGIVDQSGKSGRKKQKKKADSEELAPTEKLAIDSAESDTSLPGHSEADTQVSHEEYVLVSCELIDTDSRLMPHASGKSSWRLDHTTYQGGKLSPDHQQLQLRATQKSPYDEPEQATVASLFETALNVANRLNDAGRQLKHRISNMK